MTQFALLLVPVVPLTLLLLLALPVPALRGLVRLLVPLAPLPALLVSISAAGPMTVTLDWLLLGTVFALTDLSQPFLFFTALLWGLAGWQATAMMQNEAQGDRFTAFFLIAMTGNLGLLLAQDIASFYTFFAAMSLAAWGLVLHAGGEAQRFAGKIYIAFAVLGEVLLFAGLAVGASATGQMDMAAMAAPNVPPIALVLAGAGFLIKIGTVPLHIWLPLAHSAAPAPASAVLSGAMLKAGLFGLIMILPLGETALPLLGGTLAALSIAGLLVAPIFGLVQGDPKAVLAFSSIGQTSLMTLALSAAMIVPEAWPMILPGVVLLVVHHGFSKAALFIGVPAIWSTSDRVARITLLTALCLPALALAGLPWTSGFEAKKAVEAGLDVAATGLGRWAVWIAPMLTLSSIGTAVLMIRAVRLMADAKARPMPAGVSSPLVAALGLSVVGIWLAPGIDIVPASPIAADFSPFVIAGLAALTVSLGLRMAGVKLEPVAPGQFLSVFRTDPNKVSPWPSLFAQRAPRPLSSGRHRFSALRPEFGGLTILGVVAVFATLAVIAGVA